MPIDLPHGRAVFFFAHQDDEFGVFRQLEAERAAGRAVECIYLTDGECRGVTSQERDAESLSVLAALGVRADAVRFAGRELGIGDGAIAERAADATHWIERRLAALDGDDVVYVPAWEGGHQDHDALHALVVQAAARRGLLERVRQFPLYNKHGVPKPLFRVLNPIDANGPATSVPIPPRDRLRYLGLCLRYRSQWRSWVGLLPFVVLNYATRGEQVLQPVSLERLGQRPHEGELLYEARRTCRWEVVARVVG
ncbi:PIG-L deacetylase family protein [Ramlibacter sp.]|uniref:PIG-L deacetylase family protein n=1 Tax=Ramlibacter sp. TaxID=1917967 RepID=UPI003D0F68F2